MNCRAIILALSLIGAAAPAHAGPVGALFTAIGGFVAASPVLTFLARIVVSVALSRLAALLAPKPKTPGIRTDGAAGGSQNPANFLIGRYATDGVLPCPPMSHGPNNDFLTMVVELSDVPGVALSRLMIGEEWVEIGATESPEGYGREVLGKFAGYAWVKFYDGTQTAADPMLLAKYAGYPDRPWRVDMVGRGIAYAIVTLAYNRELFNSIPRLRFELDGIPLYDPRADSTVGGSGAQRWNDPATWQPSANPMVAVYNIHRGISVGGQVWGFGNRAEDLPLDSVFAAMNACDALVSDGDGGTEPAFRVGYEVFVTDEPAAICEELMKACMGQAVEVGGAWRFRVGAPGAALAALTDGDIYVTRAQTLQPFRPLGETVNAITAAHPLPESLYQAVDAPPLFNAAWEAEDGGRRRPVDLQLPAVTNPRQVQRLMAAYIAEERRARRHAVTLPPDWFAFEPFDTINWTSDANGYAGKLFEVAQAAISLREPLVQLSIVERDPGDYVPPVAFTLPEAASAVAVVPVVALDLFAVAPLSLPDGAGAARRPALRLTWDGQAVASARGVEWELRLTASGVVVANGTHQNAGAGSLILSGLLSATGYEVRARPVTDRQSLWSGWVAAVTPDIRLSVADLADPVQVALDQAAAAEGLVNAARAEAAAALAIQVPRVADAEAALAVMADQVSWLAARGNSTEQALAQAGLIIDPATGKARLEAISRLDGQLTEVGVTLDAVQGALSLRVTQADVDLAIAAAQLDPAELPIIGALEGRVTDLEIGLSAADAAILQRATVVDFSALETTVGTASTRIDALELQIVQKVEGATFTALETRVSTAEVTLAAIDGAGLVIEVSDLRQRLDGQEGVADAALAGLVQTHEETLARLADAAFVRQEYHALVDGERVARATLRTELGAAIDANQAQIVAESQARADADSATATQIASVAATAAGRNRTFSQASAPVGAVAGDLWFDTSANNRARRWSGSAWVDTSDTRIAENAAAVTTEALARVAADSALATQINTVAASVGDLESEVSTQATALATVEGNLAASFVLRARAGGAVGEVEVVAADGPAGPASAVVIRSDRFSFVGDLAEFLGDVRISGALIVDGWVTKGYDLTFGANFTAAAGSPQTVAAITTEGQSGATTAKLGFTVTRSGTAGATFDWQLESVSAIYFANTRVLASGACTVPPGLISGFALEESAIAFEHRDLPIGSILRLRIFNLTNAAVITGRLVVEQRLLPI